MKEHNSTIFSVLIFMLKSNYLIYIYLFIPLLMKSYGNVSYLTTLIFIPIVCILIFFLPKKITDINYFERLNKTFIPKISFCLNQLISVFMNTIIVSYVIHRIFFYNYSLILFLVATVVIVIYISNSEVEVIFNSSTFLFLVAILLVLFPVFLATDVRDFTLLKPFYMFEGMEFILLLYFVLDGVCILYSNAKTKKKITKGKLLIPLITMFIFMSLELLNIIIITGDRYLIDNEFLGFFTLFIQDTINYIGNLGLLFIYIIPITGCFKAGYSLRKIKDIFKIKDTLLTNVVLTLFFLIISYLTIYFIKLPFLFMWLIIASTILLSILYIFIIINRSLNYEIIF